jgi:hypothetical protein
MLAKPYTYNGQEGWLLYDPATHAIAFASNQDQFNYYLNNYAYYTGNYVFCLIYVEPPSPEAKLVLTLT